jgi:hypothetical protein
MMEELRKKKQLEMQQMMQMKPPFIMTSEEE